MANGGHIEVQYQKRDVQMTYKKVVKSSDMIILHSLLVAHVYFFGGDFAE